MCFVYESRINVNMVYDFNNLKIPIVASETKESFELIIIVCRQVNFIFIKWGQRERAKSMIKYGKFHENGKSFKTFRKETVDEIEFLGTLKIIVPFYRCMNFLLNSY